MTTDRPRATIVYLTKNGGSAFLRSLELVLTQEASFPYEVLIIDSGSIDGTIAEAEERGVRVVKIPAESFNYGGTKNLSARLAEGDIIVFLSQDNIPASHEWLSTLLACFEQARAPANQEAITGGSGAVSSIPEKPGGGIAYTDRAFRPAI